MLERLTFLPERHRCERAQRLGVGSGCQLVRPSPGRQGSDDHLNDPMVQGEHLSLAYPGIAGLRGRSIVYDVYFTVERGRMSSLPPRPR
jgi:hypothetical protein